MANSILFRRDIELISQRIEMMWYMAGISTFPWYWIFEISRWYFCGTRSFALLTTTLPTAYHTHKKTINLDSFKELAKFLKNSWVVTVFVKTLYYNRPKTWNPHSAIENPKWEGRICQTRVLWYPVTRIQYPGFPLKTGSSTSIEYPESSPQFPLTFESVRFKQQSAVFPN